MDAQQPSVKRHDLTASQAQALAEIVLRRRQAALEWQRALLFVGVDPESIVTGNLNDDPHFMVKVEE